MNGAMTGTCPWCGAPVYPGAPHCAKKECAIKACTAVVAAQAANPPRPIVIVRRGERSEMCQPCGSCRACERDAKARRDVRLLRREVRRLLALLKRAEGAIQDECDASGEDEVRDHPILRSHARLAAHIRAVIDEKEAKAKVHP